MRWGFIICLLVCGVAWTEEPPADRALWEIGVVGAGSYLPDYPAADHSRLKWIAAPYGIYRGKIMRADREGARARFLRGRYYEIDLGVAGSFATRSKDNPARSGMPDLDYILELGPRLSLTLSRLGGKGKLGFFLPVRAVFSTDLGDFHHRGFSAAPALHARWPIAHSDWLAVTQLTGTFGDRPLNAYFYDVPAAFANPQRPVYDARAGYIGSDLFGGVIVPVNRRLRVFSGAQVLLHSASANQASPLFKNRVNYSVAAGLIWMVYRSPKLAEME